MALGDGGELSARDLCSRLNRTNSSKLRNNILLPLMKSGYIVQTLQPAKHPNQKYKITDAGRKFIEQLGKCI